MRVLVTGATGFVGRRLVPVLVDSGHRVRAVVRDPDRYDAPAGVEVVRGDLLDPGSIAGACDRIDAAYYLVHSLSAGRDFAERDRLAARNFVEATRAGGVGRVVYLGGLGETGEGLSAHLRSRREVEAIIVGAGSASFTMIRQLAQRLPVMVTPRWVRTRCQPVGIEDVVAYLVGVLDRPETAGDTFEIGGPEVLTYEQMLVRTARLLGRPPPLVLAVPVLTPQLSAYWVDLVTDVPASIAHPLIDGLRNPVVVTDDRLAAMLPIERTPFDVAVERALAEEAGAQRSEVPMAME